ncbi:MAG: DUF523 and DUF1722 domain-containing protein [Planctomycetes bacterium]|nr:DUF523 and DUF1722 domain-containing protein [Planctomycetota bacterium]
MDEPAVGSDPSTPASGAPDAAATVVAPLRVGISACLLGQKVRWNAGHERDPFLVETVGRFVEWVPVCPEFELGLGVPRETLRLVQRDGAVRLVARKSGTDHTDGMTALAATRSAELADADLCGFVFKKDSPSCGLMRVRLYDAHGMPSKTGQGLFAAAMAAACPQLPMEEEGRLHDPRLRENFFERLFAWRRLRERFAGRFTVGDLVAFHSREKLLLMAHSPKLYQELGRLVAHAKGRPRAELAADYRRQFMEALATLATTRRHVNVLQHMAGYVSKQLDGDGRAELTGSIADFGAGLVPLIVPLTLLRHHVRRFAVDYLAQQTYLDPHPKELMLRNHV